MSVSWQERMQRRLHLLPITNLQKNLGVQDLRKAQTTQMFSKGQFTATFMACPGLCLLVLCQKGTEVRNWGWEFTLLQLGVVPRLAAASPKRKGIIYHWEDKASPVHLGEGCGSGELCWSHRAAWSQQAAAQRVHQICKCYWFICTVLYKQPSHSPHRNSSS